MLSTWKTSESKMKKKSFKKVFFPQLRRKKYSEEGDYGASWTHRKDHSTLQAGARDSFGLAEKVVSFE